ncbi:hypothetical protein IFM89_025651 [Coptis chinensis]|uniref:EF-hand domain-containing protein n=1 Tax=Coptis chinensis TaxID=261450 RepID=A0A835H647_9MAGN|nr:hypothetical protein IFM89_015043 [Coptis chinensis]KAF9593860.1 hypothetical protein IFM89_025651 [Coptis chinensis]
MELFPASAGKYGYWQQSTTVSYGSPGSPPRSPSPPPYQPMSYEKQYYSTNNNNEKQYYSNNNKYQANRMGAITSYANGRNGSLIDDLLPSSFPPGTDPKAAALFQKADQDGNGFIDDKELKSALSSYSSTFSIRTVRLLMYAFTGTNTRIIGPKEFVAVYHGLQRWKGIFQNFDRDRNGKIDLSELREALRNLGYPVTERILNLLIVKFDKNGGNSMGVGFDGFIECCLTVKGLTDKFKEKEQISYGSASFTYEEFMSTVLPLIVA